MWCQESGCAAALPRSHSTRASVVPPEALDRGQDCSYRMRSATRNNTHLNTLLVGIARMRMGRRHTLGRASLLVVARSLRPAPHSLQHFLGCGTIKRASPGREGALTRTRLPGRRLAIQWPLFNLRLDDEKAIQKARPGERTHLIDGGCAACLPQFKLFTAAHPRARY